VDIRTFLPAVACALALSICAAPTAPAETINVTYSLNGSGTGDPLNPGPGIRRRFCNPLHHFMASTRGHHMNVTTPDSTTPISEHDDSAPMGHCPPGPHWVQFGQTALVVSVGAIRPSHPMRFQACAPTNGQVLVVGKQEVIRSLPLTVAVGTTIADRPPGGRRQLPTSGSHRT
jgi:hypothetical protein